MSSEDLSNALKQMIVDDLGEKVRILIDDGLKELEDRENMSDNTRDTQFQGFAKLVWEEIANKFGEWWETDAAFTSDQSRDIIARRAYDLVKHTIENTAHIDLDRELPEDHALLIPDMTELTKEPS